MPVVWHQPVVCPMLTPPGSWPRYSSTTPSSGFDSRKSVRKLQAEPEFETVQYETSARAALGMPASQVAEPAGVMSLLTPQAKKPSDASGVPWYGVATLWIRRAPVARSSPLE